MIKKLTLFLVLMFAITLMFAQKQQAPTISNVNARVTVTNEQIKAWGDADQQGASRSLIVLTFEGLGNQDAILNFYNGGLSVNGFGPGPNYGITFGGSTLSLIDSDNGGSGNFANEPSPNTAMFFLTGGGAVMNVPALYPLCGCGLCL
jgi:hypothetical protein